MALDRGHDATHVTFRGLNGTQDWNLLPAIRDGNLISSPIIGPDVLKLYAAEDIHNGLIVIVPSISRDGQVALFEAALDVIEQRSRLVNVLVEVFEDRRVEVRDWSSESYEPRHMSGPKGR